MSAAERIQEALAAHPSWTWRDGQAVCIACGEPLRWWIADDESVADAFDAHQAQRIIAELGITEETEWGATVQGHPLRFEDEQEARYHASLMPDRIVVSRTVSKMPPIYSDWQETE